MHNKRTSDIDASSKKARKIRSVIELPTTEPDFELLAFYTSDEECQLSGNFMDDETYPKAYKHLIRNELRRGLLCQSGIKQMPPELIITPAQRSASGERAASAKHHVSTSDGEELRIFDGSLMMSQLPPIGIQPKRHHTWHNFKKCVPSLRYTNFYTEKLFKK